MAKSDRKALLTRPAYSEQAHRLAQELGRKAAANLRKSGYEVEQSSDGTWRVLSRPGSTR